MYKFPIYWSESMKTSFLQRVILVHSFLYYEEDSSIWSDRKYDSIAKQLVELQSQFDKEYLVNYTDYGYATYDYDGTTGFDLWERLFTEDKKYIRTIASAIVRNAI